MIYEIEYKYEIELLLQFHIHTYFILHTPRLA